MENNFEHLNTEINFIKPDLETEIGEINRVGQIFAPDDLEMFSKRFVEIAQKTNLTSLSENEWQKLENADSFIISEGDWESVAKQTQNNGRDWKSLKEKMESGQEIDAPIIMKLHKHLHLVSGNTRLMVSRALAKTPKVLIVDVS